MVTFDIKTNVSPTQEPSYSWSYGSWFTTAYAISAYHN